MLPLWLVEELSSTKWIPGAKKVGDHSIGAQEEDGFRRSGQEDIWGNHQRVIGGIIES